jgi:hypothetical protein
MEAAGGEQHETRRRAGAGLALLGVVYSSLLLNAIFVAHHFLSPSRLLLRDDGRGCGLTWSLQAAREAEAVAAVECSGHGQVFVDGVAGEDGRPGCECNSCFGGPDCSLRTPNCTADADRHTRFSLPCLLVSAGALDKSLPVHDGRIIIFPFLSIIRLKQILLLVLFRYLLQFTDIEVDLCGI